MYYDRSVPQAFLGIVKSSAFFARLRLMLDSPWGQESLAHIELRRSAAVKWGLN